MTNNLSMMDFGQGGKPTTYRPDMLKSNLHTVQVVMLDAEGMLKGSEIGNVDTRDFRGSFQKENKDGSTTTKDLTLHKITASSLSSSINFTSSIAITDLINQNFQSMGSLGAFAFNRMDKIDSEFFGGGLGRALGSVGGPSKLPPLVPQLSYERLTAYGGASAVESNIELLFVFKDDFKKDVSSKVEALSNWYLPNRMSGSIGEVLGKSVDLLKPAKGDSSIVEGLKAIGSSIVDVGSNIFENCFFLEVPVGARNPTRIYFGPEGSKMSPVYCGEWLVKNFSMKTSNFVVYDEASNCLRPDVVQITLGLLSWRVTDNKTFQIFR